MANVSHELKTPVTSIKGFAETLLDGAMNEKQTLDSFLKIIYKESDRLQSLINDLLELSKIEQDAFKLYKEQVELSTLIYDIVETLKKEADNKNIQLQVHADGPTYVSGDKPRLQQIFINLISNAISYTPASGQVDINIGEDADLSISLSDTEWDSCRNRESLNGLRVDKARSQDSGGTDWGWPS